MTNDIWCRAWVQGKGGSIGASVMTGSGSQSPVAHQSSGTSQMNHQTHEREEGNHGQGGSSGGAGSAHAMGQPSPDHSTTKGTGGTPAGTGGSKNIIPN